MELNSIFNLKLLPMGSLFFPVVVGFASSFTHCAGMCGPIHFFMASKGKVGNSIWLYHGGRIFGYGILGLLIGILGHFFSSLTSPTFRISAGIVLAILYLFFGLGLLGFIPAKYQFEKLLQFIFPVKFLGKISGSESNKIWLLPAGMAASLLPCPSTHAVLLWSLGLNSIWKSSASMILLGVSTMPIFAILSFKFISRPAWSGKLYQGLLGIIFLGLSVWRIYGLATRGPVSCH